MNIWATVIKQTDINTQNFVKRYEKLHTNVKLTNKYGKSYTNGSVECAEFI
jgi:hypothetical protein